MLNGSEAMKRADIDLSRRDTLRMIGAGAVSLMAHVAQTHGAAPPRAAAGRTPRQISRVRFASRRAYERSCALARASGTKA